MERECKLDNSDESSNKRCLHIQESEEILPPKTMKMSSAEEASSLFLSSSASKSIGIEQEKAAPMSTGVTGPAVKTGWLKPPKGKTLPRVGSEYQAII